MRSSPDELAIFGGAPAFEEPRHVGAPNLGNRERLLERIGAAYDRRWLTNEGPLVKEFERRVADVSGVEHCVAVSSGTTGLQLLARAPELTGEVIVPSFTFVATAHALAWLGLKPVFCEVDPDTHTLDPNMLPALVTPRTSAIVGVHLWGRPCEIDELGEFAANRRLALLFDAAHAIGCSYRGRSIGAFGDGSVFSSHATKV